MPMPDEVESVPWSKRQAQLAYAMPYTLVIAQITFLDARNSVSDARSGLPVTQRPKPSVEHIGFEDFDHDR